MAAVIEIPIFVPVRESVEHHEVEHLVLPRDRRRMKGALDKLVQIEIANGLKRHGTISFVLQTVRIQNGRNWRRRLCDIAGYLSAAAPFIASPLTGLAGTNRPIVAFAMTIAISKQRVPDAGAAPARK
jgi:hypothetical protein